MLADGSWARGLGCVSVRANYYRLFLLALATVLAAGGCDRGSGDARQSALPIRAENKPKPNIVLIVVDTLRADRLASYGGPAKTPVMDSIAREGVLFERCISAAPWTVPSMASLFTGFYPGVHKATDYRQVEAIRKASVDRDGGELPGTQSETRTEVSVLSDDFQTLAEILHADGYETAAFVANPFLQPENGFGQGFDTYNAGVLENGFKGRDLNGNVRAWLDKRSSTKPLFLYVHYMDPHGPYDAPPEIVDPLVKKVDANPNKTILDARQRQALHPQSYLRRTPPGGLEVYARLQGYREYWLAGYDACIVEADLYVGDLIADLNKRGLWSDSLSILVSDHGEAFAEHGYWEHGPGQHQTQVHVPFAMRWPGVISAGRKVTDTVRTIDLLPTLLEMLRIQSDATTQGDSLVKHVAGDRSRRALTAFAEAAKHPLIRQEAIVSGNWKLLRTAAGLLDPSRRVVQGFAEPTYQLFDLAADSGEQRDIAATKPETVRELIKLMADQDRENASAKPGIVSKLVQQSARVGTAIGQLGYAGSGGADDDNAVNASPPTTTSAPASRVVP